jgi:cyclopropane-fatty-acyl-phospholipid synthase
MNAQRTVAELLSRAGIGINGSQSWDIRVRNEQTFPRILARGSLGLGETYMEGWWECAALDEFFYRILAAGLHARLPAFFTHLLPYLRAKLLNSQKSNPHHIGAWHYDLGNDLYAAMLGRTMQYSCGYWKNAASLDEAQDSKLELICDKLALTSDDVLLDIGCGWGTLLRYAAERCGAGGVGVTVSKQQAARARELNAGLPVEIVVQDYRTIEGIFNKIVSVGMLEHVGHKNYRDFMRAAHIRLHDDGLFLVHTIGRNTCASGPTDPWIDRYIFPNGQLPSIAQLARSAEGFFMIEDVHSFGPDYDTTLRAWHANFVRSWPDLQHSYDSRFFRMWTYYLLMCAAAFRSRHIQLWQIVLRKEGAGGVYQSVR